jgi:hypothetical protein
MLLRSVLKHSMCEWIGSDTKPTVYSVVYPKEKYFERKWASSVKSKLPKKLKHVIRVSREGRPMPTVETEANGKYT